MKRLGGLLRRVRGDRGYTLVELLVVLVILTVVMTALTTLFVSGARAELEQNRRYQAQHEARMALERLRREVHCASAVSGTPGTPISLVTITLPAACPSAETTIVWSTAVSANEGYVLRRGTVIVADFLTTADVFTYYAPSSASLGRLHVDFPVDVHPSGGSTAWELVDDIVLRNTVRA